MRYAHVEVTRRGGPQVLALCTGELRPPGTGEARLAVAAAGVSYGDVLLRAGVIPNGPKPPFTPGFAVAGTVESVGDGVRGLSAGQPVVALLPRGGYTSGALVPAARLVPVPPGLAPEQVAAAALDFFVAHQMLRRVAHCEPGQRIVVHGAAGGVGQALLQLARRGGVAVIGTSSAVKRDLVTGLGAEHVDYREADLWTALGRLAPDGVDAVFDPIGGRHFWRSYGLLRRRGVLVGYGQSAALRDGRRDLRTGAIGFLGGIVLPKLLPDGRSTVFYNAWSLERRLPEAYREDLVHVLELLADGEVRPPLFRRLPLADAATAHELVGSSVVGKVVLDCTTGAGARR